MRAWFFSSKAGLGLAAVVLAVMLLTKAEPAGATGIAILGAAPDAEIGGCDLRAGGSGGICRSTAFVDGLPADPSTSAFLAGNFHGLAPTTETFTTAFSNWNQANGNLWTLVDGGSLDLTLDVTYAAAADPKLGGIGSIGIHFDGYHPTGDDPAIRQLGWVQGVYSNYRPPFTNGIDAPEATLDTYGFSNGGSFAWGGHGPFSMACVEIPNSSPAPNNVAAAPFSYGNPLAFDSAGALVDQPYCDPIYPFQQSSEDFFDAPMGLWDDASYRAITLPATIAYASDAAGNVISRTLTVYDGVNWGFDLLAIPEPASLALFGPGLIGLAALRPRRGRSRIKPVAPRHAIRQAGRASHPHRRTRRTGCSARARLGCGSHA